MNYSNRSKPLKDTPAWLQKTFFRIFNINYYIYEFLSPTLWMRKRDREQPKW